MKSLAIGFALLGFVACGSLPPFNPTAGGTTGSSTGAKTSSGTTGRATSSAAATSGGSSTGPGTTGASAGSTTGPATSSGTTGGAGSSTGGNGSTSGSYLGTPCSVNAQTGLDTCVVHGLQCTAEANPTLPGTCVLPLELGTCLTEVGCQDGGQPELACTDGFSNSNGNVKLCLYPCTTTNDCASTLEQCISLGVCFTDYCNIVNGSFQGPYFNACDVDDAGAKGQCMGFGTGANQFGICIQNGFDFAGGACNPLTRVGSDSSCSFGNICLPSQEGGDGGECVPITIDGGCGDGLVPLPFFTNGDFDVCVQDCTETGTCDVGQCYNDTQTAELVCLP